jgi:hypothetical protein
MPLNPVKQTNHPFKALKELLFQAHPLAIFTTLSLFQIIITYTFCFYVLITKNSRQLPQELIEFLPSLRRYQHWGNEIGNPTLVNDVLISYAGCFLIQILFFCGNAVILIYRYKIKTSAPLDLAKAVFVGMLIISIYPNAEIIWGPFVMGQTGLFSNSLFAGNETLSYFHHAPLAFANFFLFILLGGGMYRYPSTDWQSRKLRDM